MIRRSLYIVQVVLCLTSLNGCLTINETIPDAKNAASPNSEINRCLDASAFPIYDADDFRLMLNLLNEKEELSEHVFGDYKGDDADNERMRVKDYYSDICKFDCVSDCGFVAESCLAMVSIFSRDESVKNMFFSVESLDGLYYFFNAVFAETGGLTMNMYYFRGMFGEHVMEWHSKHHGIYLKLFVTGAWDRDYVLRVVSDDSGWGGRIYQGEFDCDRIARRSYESSASYSTESCPSEGFGQSEYSKFW